MRALKKKGTKTYSINPVYNDTAEYMKSEWVAVNPGTDTAVMAAMIYELEVTGEAGAGMVKITVTCKHEAKRVEIDPSLLSGSEDDKEMLEDLIAAAINDAAHKAEAAAQQKMREATAGMPLPPGMKLPF